MRGKKKRLNKGFAFAIIKLQFMVKRVAKVGHTKVISKKRKNKKSPDLAKDTMLLVGSCLNVVLAFYMLMLIVVMPFYFTDGYANIGTDKHNFLYRTSGAVGILFGLLLLGYVALWLCIWVREQKDKYWTLKNFWNGLSWTDKFAMGYGMVVLLSYFVSKYQAPNELGDAWKGAAGWYMGASTQLLFLGIYFAVSRLWKPSKWLPALWIPVTAVLFGLGYVNRFQVYPIQMCNVTKDFISTIGNINWYCCYMVLIFFGVLYYIWSRTEQVSWVNIVFIIWMVLGFGALVTQGSMSGIVTLIVMLIVLYCFSMKEYESLQMFFTCIVCLGMACTVTYCWRSISPAAFNYHDKIVDLLTNSPVAFLLSGVAAIFILILLYLHKRETRTLKIFCLIGYIGVGFAVLSLLVFVGLIIINTGKPGSIGRLSELAIFTFDGNWGTLRGIDWRAGLHIFMTQNVVGKLVGVGPDCMVRYLYSGGDVELLRQIYQYYPTVNLTNAHCEWLTVLVNTGLLGLVTYVGMMLTAIGRYLKIRKQAPIIGACGFAILAYTINNLFSFQQSMGTTTLFIILGMGEAYVRSVQKTN